MSYIDDIKKKTTTPSPQDWKKRFDEKFSSLKECYDRECMGEHPHWEYAALESFISDLLVEEKRELLTKAIARIEKEQLQSGTGFRHYNQGLTRAQDILASLTHNI